MTPNAESIRDEWLVLRCQSGEADALAELLRRWHGRLLEHARRLVRHDADAADALQDALIGIAKSIRRLDDPALFGPWARRIVANKCADSIKRRQQARRVSDEARTRASAVPTADPIAQEHALRMRLAIEQLPIEVRALLVMRYGRDMSTAQMATAMGIREGTVKSRLHHARQELKSILEKISL